MGAEVGDQGIEVNLAAQAVCAIDEDAEVIATISQEAIYRHPVACAEINWYTTDHD